MYLIYAVFTLLLACIAEATRTQVGDILAMHNVDNSDIKGLKLAGDDTILQSKNGDVTTITDADLAKDLDVYNQKASPTLKSSRFFPPTKTGLLDPRSMGNTNCPPLCGGDSTCTGTTSSGVTCSGACLKACSPDGEECFTYCVY